jgi:NADPH-dependent 2,4-dienoyl-CoA reductase/sulfur reductase-like enzyme/peroxiredoxin family protein/TusA-related sulfurtransferase/rhodanese-related sulfurtransferase
MSTTHNDTNALNFVIIGGVAAGAGAAARARRLNESAHITVIERGPDVSFANCGLPYHIGGEIADRDRLAVQTPESLKAMLNLDVHPLTEAVRIDRARKCVVVRAVDGGAERELPYDKLLLAPGASPLRPPLPGIDDPRILTLRNLQDMDRIKAAVATAHRVAVIGAGFIGLEMAEQLVRLGKATRIVELQEQVLPQLDSEMTALVARALVENGVGLILGDGIKAFHPRVDAVAIELNSGRRFDTDVVILSIGVRPENKLAKDAGLELGPRGHITVNDFMQTSDPDIYAAGDAVETRDAVLDRKTSVPLGGPANRQGRLVADHILGDGKVRPYPGSVGTAIVRVFDAVAGMTGWPEKRLAVEGIASGSTIVTDFHHAGYFPGAQQLSIKVIWNLADGRLLGAQVTGTEGVDKRLDVLATAIRARMTVEDLAELELAYAPPFGSAKDTVNIAGMAAGNIRAGLVEPLREIPTDPAIQIVDVRPAAMAQLQPMPGALAIPLTELRGRLGELDKSRPVATVCALGKMSYFAARILRQHGFDARSVSGGMRARLDFPAAAKSTNDDNKNDTDMKPTPATTAAHASSDEPAIRLDATGIACPGPVMRVKEACDKLAPGHILEVTASDAGFAKDLPAFCAATGREFLGVEKHGGIYRGRLRQPACSASSAPTAATPANNGATIVVFSQEMDRAMASLVIANGALAMGGPVTLFFTFWGLNVLRKDRQPAVEGKTFMDKMFGWMMPRGVNRLPLSNMHMAGMGTRMMKWRMASKNLPNLPGLLADAQRNGARIVACSMSMDAMGIRKEEMIDGVEIGGVADFLAATRQTSANLFI